jgi:hypothetical protein
VNVLDGKHGDNTVFPCLESPAFTRVWAYKRILPAEDHHINITNYKIPQVIAVESYVKFDWMIIIDH